MTPLHVFLVTLGSSGDVYPFVAIGRALLLRGHNVTLVTSSYFEDVAAEEGFAFAGLGTKDNFARIISDPDLWHPRHGFKVLARRVLVPAIRPVYDVLSRSISRNSIVVAQGQAFGAHLAHEKHHGSFVTLNLQPIAFRTAYESPLFPSWLPVWGRRLVNRAVDSLILDRELAGPINAVRSDLGLNPISRVFGVWAHSPQATIGLFPEWFASPQPDWPANTTLSGFVRLKQPPSLLLPGLQNFLRAGAPPIVFTPGTGMKHAHDFFRTSVEVLQKLGLRGIFLSRFEEHIPSRLPKSVFSCSYIPFASVLPSVAAIVHHGGIGTVAESLSAEIPQVIRPMAHDQPDNAARIERLGVGVSIAPDRYTANRVHAALDRLLTSREVLQACRTYSSKIDFQQALNAVCETIEEVAQN